jgi:O-antigen ligase
MLNTSVEKTIAGFLLIGVPFTTLFLVTGTVSDPVNITKLFAAGCLGGGVLAIALVYGSKELWRTSRLLVLATILLLIAMLNAAFSSNTPMSQNLYGVFGRNTGLIAYLLLSGIALSAALLRRQRSFEYLIWALIFSGVVNIVYCGWALAFGDFIGWNNPYGEILGLFGNPNFIGAFLGMFISGSLAITIGRIHDWRYPALLIPLSCIALYEIKASKAVQGLVVTGAGLAIIGFYFVRSRSKGNLATAIYVFLVSIVGAFAVGGALQRGPLASIIYKKSVSLRGTYWETGIEMAKAHPFTGVGMDSYGNYYRQFRPDRALVDTPAVGTVTNAAHNVVIDFFASGGYPLLITYVAIMALGLWAIIRVTLRARKYDDVFVALAATWLTYQLQSIISINQVGLAIWGWVLVGALVAYEYTTRPQGDAPVKSKVTKQKELVFSPQLVGGIGVVIGALIAVPPLSADSKWRSAVTSQSAQNVEAALTPSYLSPADSTRYITAVQTFESSKLYDLAYKYAQIGVAFSPDSSDSWRMLYAVSKSTQADKDLALANMKRLDPKNPDVLAQ